MSFQNLHLSDLLLRAVADEGYTVPTPIQTQAIPHVLAGGDIMGCAQTGTGKTAAFALPILHRLLQQPHTGQSKPPIRTLVLAPTRELAAQINESFNSYGRHTRIRCAAIFGGVKQNPQVRSLAAGLDILVATPGRLLDLMNQGFVDLKQVQILVLDEADNMLDMGFIHDIRKIVTRIPKQRQTLMFSATMPREIRDLAQSILHNPIRVDVAPEATPIETVDHSIIFVTKNDKPSMLVHYIRSNPVERVLVFVRTKHGADRVVKHLVRCGINSQAIHGNKSQNHRVRAIINFKSDTPPVLVATDIAARGLDIDKVSHVVNFDLPNVPETYVHRIGRTGRAGASGIAVSFCDGEERPYLRDIEKLTRLHIRVDATPNALPKPPAGPVHGFHEPAQTHAQPMYATKPQRRGGEQQPRYIKSPPARPQHHSGGGNFPHSPAAAAHHAPSPGRPRPQGQGAHHAPQGQGVLHSAQPHSKSPGQRTGHADARPASSARPSSSGRPAPAHPIHGQRHTGPASANRHSGGFRGNSPRPAGNRTGKRF